MAPSYCEAAFISTAHTEEDLTDRRGGGPGLRRRRGPLAVELRLRLATRASKLALAQSKWVAAQITERHPGVRVELVTVTTRGDAVQDRALSKVGGKGLFTKEIEDALLCGGADLAVHSLKDLPTALPEGLTLGAICGAEDARTSCVAE